MRHASAYNSRQGSVLHSQQKVWGIACQVTVGWPKKKCRTRIIIKQEHSDNETVKASIYILRERSGARCSEIQKTFTRCGKLFFFFMKNREKLQWIFSWNMETVSFEWDKFTSYPKNQLKACQAIFKTSHWSTMSSTNSCKESWDLSGE